MIMVFIVIDQRSILSFKALVLELFSNVHSIDFGSGIVVLIH